MKNGDRLRISGAAGTVDGEVVDVRTPATLPDLPQAGVEAWPARAILEEWGVSRIALLKYQMRLRGPGQHSKLVCFTALEVGGRWFDLKSQELTFSPIPSPRGRFRRLYG